jgi:hypothetical protein
LNAIPFARDLAPRGAVRSDPWAAIWASGFALVPPQPWTDPTPQPALTLFLEFTVPSVDKKGPLRLWQGAAATHRAIALYAQANGALRLVHDEIDLTTPPGFVRGGETVSLRYRCCARGRGDVIDFINHDSAQRSRLRTRLARAARLDEALPRDMGFLKVCHIAAIATFGVAPSDVPGLAAGAIVSTTRGPRAVQELRPDMVLMTVDGDTLPLRWIERRPRLCLGRSGPVRLRAPYFGLSHDICVPPETRVMRSGPAVEYIFGHERVLMRAGDIISSPGATRDRSHPVRDIYHLMLDAHACVAIDRCGIETALLSDVVMAEDGRAKPNLAEVDRTPCLPVLDRAGAQALMAASARGGRSLI